MELRHLRSFVTIVEAGSFTRAAERLHLSQPALSAQIRRLEAAMEARLLERTARGVTPTDAGRALLAEARALVAGADRATALVRRVAAGAVGELSVGFLPAASNRVLPRLLRDYRRRFPDVALRLAELPPDALADGLRDRRFDVALLYLPLDDPSLVSRVLETETIVAALPAGHALAGRRAVALHELAGERFVLPARHQLPSLHARVMDACRAAGFEPRPAQEDVWLLQTTVSLVAAGIGVALVPDSVRHLARAGVELRPLLGDVPRLELAAAWRHGGASPVLAGFLATCAPAEAFRS